VASVGLLTLASCSTAPPAPPSALSRYLPSDASAYLYADVLRSGALPNHVLSAAGIEGRDAQRVLDRTRQVAMAIGTTTAGNAPAFVVVASGRFPGFVIEAQLQKEGWTRRSVADGEQRYGVWTRKGAGVEVSVPSRRVLMAGSSGLAAALQRAPLEDAPGAAAADSHSAVVAVPRTEISAPFGSKRIEIRDFELRGSRQLDGRRASAESAEFAAAAPGAAATWRIDGGMRLADETTARAMTALVRILTVSMLAEAGVDPQEAAGDLRVDREGRRIEIEGIMIGEKDLLDAIDQFLLTGGRQAG
jgi:hypothetical protein